MDVFTQAQAPQITNDATHLLALMSRLGPEIIEMRHFELVSDCDFVKNLGVETQKREDYGFLFGPNAKERLNEALNELIRCGYVEKKVDPIALKKTEDAPRGNFSTKHPDFDDLCAILFVAMGFRLDPKIDSIEWHMDKCISIAHKIEAGTTTALSKWELSLVSVAINVLAAGYREKRLDEDAEGLERVSRSISQGAEATTMDILKRELERLSKPGAISH